MLLKTDALIVRTYPVGEADRFLLVLTEERGLVRASARGANHLKSRKGAATALLTYSRLTLSETKSGVLTVTEAEPLRVFFDLKSDIAAVTLGQYFCELATVLAPEEEPAGDLLHLLLNALHLLAEGKKDPRLIKAVTELRLLTLAGFAPELTACRRCGGAEELSLSVREGTLTCRDCGVGLDSFPLSPTVLTALRFIVSAPPKKIFSFTVPDNELDALSQVTERFLLAQLNRDFSTLSFYHEVESLKPKNTP